MRGAALALAGGCLHAFAPSDAEARNITHEAFFTAMNACVAAFKAESFSATVDAFSGWKTIRPFKAACDTCPTKSGSFRAKQGGVEVELSVLDNGSDEETGATNFHCHSLADGSLPRYVEIMPELNEWAKQEIQRGSIFPIVRPRSKGELIYAQNGEGHCAGIHIFPNRRGLANFQMMGRQSHPDPERCK